MKPNVKETNGWTRGRAPGAGSRGSAPYFAMLFAVILRIFLFFAVSAGAFGGNLEDAAKSLAQKVLTHLAPDEAANFTWRNPAPQTVKTVLANAARRRLRNPKAVEVRVTLSENLRGNLLVAEILREDGTVVEMASAARDRPPGAQVNLKLALLWDQESPILDVAVVNDQMFVLDANGFSVYQKKNGQWSKTETSPIVDMHVRDLRGHIEVTKDAVTVDLPGEICGREAEPRVGMQCKEGGIIAKGRNTIADGDWPAHYSHVEIAGEHVLAEIDGRTHIYDVNHKPLGTFDGWSSNFAAISSACGVKILALDAASDAVAVYGIVNHQPVRLSDEAALPGAITAIWEHEASETVVARDLKTGRYGAYGATADCGN